MGKIFADAAGTTTANDGYTLEMWLQPLRVRCMSATEAVLLSELQAAVREFYLQSNAWREQIGPYSVFSDRDLVWLNPVDLYSNVNYVHAVWLQIPDRGRIELAPVTQRITEVKTDTYPSTYQCTDPYVLRLWPQATANLGMVLYADVTLVPLPDAQRLPNIAVSHHFDAILEGTMARLLAIPNKPWTDPIMSMRYAQLFRRKCIQFRGQAAQSYMRTDAPWRFPSFA